MKTYNTIKDIALKLNISEKEVKRLERNALKKILNTDIGKNLRKYLGKE